MDISKHVKDYKVYFAFVGLMELGVIVCGGCHRRVPVATQPITQIINPQGGQSRKGSAMAVKVFLEYRKPVAIPGTDITATWLESGWGTITGDKGSIDVPGIATVKFHSTISGKTIQKELHYRDSFEVFGHKMFLSGGQDYTTLVVED